jgi:hypothetical protein
MKTQLFLSAAALVFNLPLAQAMPTLYPKASSHLKDVVNKTDSSVFADHLNDSHFFVVPPDNAYGYATQFHGANTNLGFCRDMAAIQTASFKMAQTLERLASEQEQIDRDAVQAQRKYYEAKRIADEKKDSSLFLRQYGQVKDDIATSEERLTSLYDKQKECGRGTACEISVQTEIDGTTADLRTLRKLRSDLLKQNMADANAYDKAFGYATSCLAEYEGILEQSEKKAAAVQKTNTLLLEMYKTYAELEGGRVELSFESEWDKNLQDLRAANPGYSFEKMPVQDVFMNAAVIPNDRAGYLRSIPAVLDYTVNGQQGGDTLKLSGYPTNLSGNLRLSLAGACPIAMPKEFNAQNFVDGKYLFGFSAMYSFQSSFNTTIVFDYNERHFYEKVVESGSKGGFFSSKSWSSVRERKQDSKAVSFKWDVADPSNKLDFAARRAFERETLNWILTGVIPKVADPNSPTLSTPPVPANGASVAADGLMTMCGVNLYCQAGSWVLKIASSIWGRSSSSASYSTLSETDAHMTFDENTAFPVVRLTSYNMTRKEPK